MTVKTSGFLVACLLVPLAASAQGEDRWVFMPSVGIAILISEAAGEGYGTIPVQLAWFRRSTDMPFGVRTFHRASMLPFTAYSFGIASTGRFHFLGVSAGPDIEIPGVTWVTKNKEVHHARTVGIGFQGQIGAIIMPFRFLGIGMHVYAKPNMSTTPSDFQWGGSFDLLVRIGWKRLRLDSPPFASGGNPRAHGWHWADVRHQE